MELYSLLVIIHIFVGFLLVYLAAKAFNKTKYIPMFYLTFGFFLIVIGDTIVGDFIHLENEKTLDIIEETVEIFGFIFVIIAVIKS
jgi:hypothetical protein